MSENMNQTQDEKMRPGATDEKLYLAQSVSLVQHKRGCVI